MVDHTAQEFSSIHLDENVAILDFLIFKATDFVLNELDTEDERIEEKIGLHKIMVDSFLQFFILTHGKHAIPSHISPRTRLLQLSLLFCGHHPVSELDKKESGIYRWYARGRAEIFWSNRSDLADLRSLLLRDSVTDTSTFRRIACAYVKDLGYPNPELEDIDTSRNICLGDIVDLFLELTASIVHYKAVWTVSQAWLEMIGEWMRQAVLEQVLLYHAATWEDIAHIFALGYVHTPTERVAHPSIPILNTLFGIGEGENIEENSEWTRIRKEVLTEIVRKDQPFAETIENLVANHPVSDFRQTVLVFFRAVHSELPTPELQQIENGRIEGVSHEESEEILLRLRHMKP